MDGTLSIWLKAISRTNFPAAARSKRDPAAGNPLSKAEIRRIGPLCRPKGRETACLD
jgi:hypothetical protein